MSLRTRIFIIISLIVLVILGISILAWVFGKKDGAVNPDENKTPAQQANLPAGTVLYNGAPVVVAPAEQGLKPRPITTLETEQNSVRQLARIFTERYNSYSSDADFQNIREVQDLVTDALWAQISGPLSGNSPVSANFVGVTASVIGTELAAWQNGAAKVILKTVLVEEKNGVKSTRQRTANVELIKSSGKWLVDKFVWEK